MERVISNTSPLTLPWNSRQRMKGGLFVYQITHHFSPVQCYTTPSCWSTANTSSWLCLIDQMILDMIVIISMQSIAMEITDKILSRIHRISISLTSFLTPFVIILITFCSEKWKNEIVWARWTYWTEVWNMKIFMYVNYIHCIV